MSSLPLSVRMMPPLEVSGGGSGCTNTRSLRARRLTGNLLILGCLLPIAAAERYCHPAAQLSICAAVECDACYALTTGIVAQHAVGTTTDVKNYCSHLFQLLLSTAIAARSALIMQPSFVILWLLRLIRSMSLVTCASALSARAL